MLTKTQEKILTLLISSPEKKFTIRGIAKTLGKSYPLIYNNLKRLKDQELIIKQSLPPAQIITLNPFAPKEILIDLELKRKNQFLKKNKEIKVMLEYVLKTKDPFFILLIFGSFAKGTQTKDSDLDLLLITKNNKDVEKRIKDSYTKTKKSLAAIDIDDFREMAKDPDDMNIANEAKKHHIILYGVESYYQII